MSIDPSPCADAPVKATVIAVPRSHYDDFVKHPGWWAVQDDPRLTAGEYVTFDLEGGPVPYLQSLTVRVTECRKATDQDPATLGQFKLSGWWLIRYVGWFQTPCPAVHVSDAARLARIYQHDEPWHPAGEVFAPAK